jgi:thiamine biosynthesis lipoprotein
MTRRAALLTGLVLAGACSSGAPVVVERRWPVMGTYATASVASPADDAAARAVEAVRAEFERVDAVMSNWRTESELSLLNRRAASGPHAVRDPGLFRCIESALDHARRSGGAFDPTVGPLVRLWGFRPFAPRVPSEEEIGRALASVGSRRVAIDPEGRTVRFLVPGVEIDLGGIAKGFALDRARDALERHGAVSGLLDLGGNLLGWRSPPGGRAWRVGIRAPDLHETMVATIDIVDRAVATSADYENSFTSGGASYGHLLDPASGRPAVTDVLSATAIAETGLDSDALSTALFVAGSSRAAEILAETPGAEAALIVRSPAGPAMRASASLRGRLRLEATATERLPGGLRFDLPAAARPREGSGRPH